MELMFFVGLGILILLVFYASEDFLILLSNCSTKFPLYLLKAIIQGTESTVHNLVA